MRGTEKIIVSSAPLWEVRNEDLDRVLTLFLLQLRQSGRGLSAGGLVTITNRLILTVRTTFTHRFSTCNTCGSDRLASRNLSDDYQTTRGEQWRFLKGGERDDEIARKVEQKDFGRLCGLIKLSLFAFASDA